MLLPLLTLKFILRRLRVSKLPHTANIETHSWVVPPSHGNSYLSVQEHKSAKSSKLLVEDHKQDHAHQDEATNRSSARQKRSLDLL